MCEGRGVETDREGEQTKHTTTTKNFFLLEAAWVRSRAERPSVSEVSGQLRVQFGCKLSSKLTKKRIKQGKQQIKVTKFQIKMQRSAVRPGVLINDGG